MGSRCSGCPTHIPQPLTISTHVAPDPHLRLCIPPPVDSLRLPDPPLSVPATGATGWGVSIIGEQPLAEELQGQCPGPAPLALEWVTPTTGAVSPAPRGSQAVLSSTCPQEHPSRLLHFLFSLLLTSLLRFLGSPSKHANDPAVLSQGSRKGRKVALRCHHGRHTANHSVIFCHCVLSPQCCALPSALAFRHFSPFHRSSALCLVWRLLHFPLSPGQLSVR